MKPLSLRRSLMLRLGVLMLVFSGVSSVVVYRLALNFSNEAYDEWLLDSARSLSFLVQARQGHLRVDLPDATLHALVWDAHDVVLFRIDSAREGFIGGHTSLATVHGADADVGYGDVRANSQDMRAVRIVRDDIVPGDRITITVAETLNKRHRLASRVLGTVMALSALLALLTVALLRDAVTRGLRPLLTLTSALQSRADGDLAQLPDQHLSVELRTFTQAINGLLSKLDAAVQLQRRFLADAAHQLRTPLAALKVELEHAVREPDPAKHLRALTLLRSGMDRVSRLTGQLLTLARAEPGALSAVSFKRLDLYELCQDVGRRFIDLGLHAQVDFGLEGDPQTWVMGDRLLLEEAVSNLVDNALKYAGAQARITVSATRQGQTAVLTVEDDGPGVTPAELPRLSERFHRPAGSPPGGSGLALAIVREITQTHQGQMQLSLPEAGGFRVAVRLPLAPSQAQSSA